MDENERKLEQRISEQLDDLETSGGDDAEQKAKTLATLYELKLKEQQQKADRTNKVIQNVFTVVGGIAQLAFAGYWLSAGFKFEENGTFCSQTLRNGITKLPFFRK